MPYRLVAAGAVCLALAAASAAAMECRASWYGASHHDLPTASGEAFDMNALTAAHRSLPFGTRVRVTRGKRSVVVTINDRGPARWTGKCIDLSRRAAEALGMIRAGVARVRIQRTDVDAQRPTVRPSAAR